MLFFFPVVFLVFGREYHPSLLKFATIMPSLMAAIYNNNTVTVSSKTSNSVLHFFFRDYACRGLFLF